ncbi:MAG TPA: acetyl-CoA carboxylase biotin carboxyl carrier protein [Candidatus Binataceae bacterium]|jgi:acetyl-CoA carboxylase biotin carboxyl carrier protein|nr:acetyl-CoA carboxylase biotin carboxyl carrier protein [Candidatus Binataceae bacterium]
MEVREIKALLALMQEYGLTELEIDDKKKGKVRLVRGAIEGNSAAPAPQPRSQATEAKPRHVRAPAAGNSGPAAPPQLAENQRLVTSPMVGTFYRASSPEASPFVEEGDSVRKGQTLCIIEAMKMMNEIEAEVAGRIVKVLCENAHPVEYGQPLMVVEVD